MASITKVSGKSYRVCTDAENDAYDELSFKTDASDVNFTDGTDAESNLGQIKGITSDVTGEAEDIAASIKVVNQLNDSLKSLGNVQNIEFPYTPLEDGFIQYLCGVLQNNVSYLQFKENGEVYYQNGSLNAVTYSGMFFVKSGNTYTLTSSNANIKKMVFCPLH